MLKRSIENWAHLRVYLLVLGVVFVHLEVELAGGERHGARGHQPGGHEFRSRTYVYRTW